MNAFLKMTWTEIKLFLREPAAAFFTLAFPLLLLFVFGGIFGNEPTARFGGKGMIDISVPGYVAMIIGNIALMALPAALAAYREKGILRRFRATPLHPVVLMSAQLTMYLIMQMVGVALLIGAAMAVYGLKLPEASFEAFLSVLLGSCGFFALGFVLAGIASTSRSAGAMGMALYFPMLFLSGAAMPRELFPATIKRIGDFLPLTHVVELLKGLWFGQGWSLVSTSVLAAMFIAGLLITAKTFRWE